MTLPTANTTAKYGAYTSKVGMLCSAVTTPMTVMITLNQTVFDANIDLGIYKLYQIMKAA